jgi:hypothetical protein
MLRRLFCAMAAANPPRRLPAPHVQRYLVKLEYDGRGYTGAAAQRGNAALPTVQAVVEVSRPCVPGRRVRFTLTVHGRWRRRRCSGLWARRWRRCCPAARTLVYTPLRTHCTLTWTGVTATASPWYALTAGCMHAHQRRHALMADLCVPVCMCGHDTTALRALPCFIAHASCTLIR